MARKTGLFDGVNLRLCLDQHGSPEWARSLTELRQVAGGGRVCKQYADRTRGPEAGRTMHTGYVIGPRWFTVYAPVEVEAW